MSNPYKMTKSEITTILDAMMEKMTRGWEADFTEYISDYTLDGNCLVANLDNCFDDWISQYAEDPPNVIQPIGSYIEDAIKLKGYGREGGRTLFDVHHSIIYRLREAVEASDAEAFEGAEDVEDLRTGVECYMTSWLEERKREIPIKPVLKRYMDHHKGDVIKDWGRVVRLRSATPYPCLLAEMVAWCDGYKYLKSVENFGFDDEFCYEEYKADNTKVCNKHYKDTVETPLIRLQSSMRRRLVITKWIRELNEKNFTGCGFK